MNIDEAITKLTDIKASKGGDLRIYFADMLPLKKIRVVNLTVKAKIVIVSDK